MGMAGPRGGVACHGEKIGCLSRDRFRDRVEGKDWIVVMVRFLTAGFAETVRLRDRL